MLLLSLCGCSLVVDLARPFLGKTDSVPVVAPAFSLRGKAAHLQDSLHERLEWIAAQPAPKSLALRGLAFRNRPDSAVELLATFEDARRLNSHGMDRDGIRAREAERIGIQRPLQAAVLASGIVAPLAVRARFTHKDYMFQNSKTQTDSVEVLFPDSTGSHGAD
jgi:hypothetical protein